MTVSLPTFGRKPAGCSVTLSDTAAIQPTFEAPVAGAEGASLTFQVTVMDMGGLQSTDTCIVNVNAVENTPANQAPTADAGADQIVNSGDMVTLDASNSSDPDGIVASCIWKQTGGMGVTLSDPAADKPTFEAPAIGQEGATLTFQVTVMDIDGMQSTDTCEVTVNPLLFLSKRVRNRYQAVSMRTTRMTRRDDDHKQRYESKKRTDRDDDGDDDHKQRYESKKRTDRDDDGDDERKQRYESKKRTDRDDDGDDDRKQRSESKKRSDRDDD